MLESDAARPDVRLAAINWVRRMSRRLALAAYGSRIVHPLARVLDTGPAELHGPCVKCLTAMLLASGPAFLVLDRALAPVLPSLTLCLHRVRPVDATSNVGPTLPLVLTAVRGCR